MISNRVELKYWLSAKDRERVLRFLARRSLVGKNAESRYLSNPYVALAAYSFLSFMAAKWFFELLPMTFSDRFPELVVKPEFVFGNIFGFLITCVLVIGTWSFAARWWRIRKSEHSGREGVKWGEHHLVATSNDLMIRLAERCTVYKWAALLDLIESKTELLLMISPRQAVAIPKRAFKSEVEEKFFCEFIRSHMTAS